MCFAVLGGKRSTFGLSLCVVQAMSPFCSTHAQKRISTYQPTAPLADVRDIDGNRRDAVVKRIVDSAAEIAQRRKVGLREVGSRVRPRCGLWTLLYVGSRQFYSPLGATRAQKDPHLNKRSPKPARAPLTAAVPALLVKQV